MMVWLSTDDSQSNFIPNHFNEFWYFFHYFFRYIILHPYIKNIAYFNDDPTELVIKSLIFFGKKNWVLQKV